MVRVWLWLMLAVTALGAGLLLLECVLLMLLLPDDFLPVGIGGWLLLIFLIRYGIPVTLILTLAALAITAILAKYAKPIP